MDVPPPSFFGTRRRGLLAFGLGALALAALPRLAERLRPLPGLAADPALPGFRRLDAGAYSAPPAATAGLDAGTLPGPALPDLCGALFGVDRPAGVVPVAVFTDINCPHCRVMEPWLTDLPAATVALTWHDLPLLGPASEAGARAIAAAEAQGAGPALRGRLHRTRFQPDAAYLTAIAAGMGLDPVRLLADMAAPATDERLARTRALARALALPGTPSLVVGDIIAPGALDRGTLDALVRAAHPPGCG